MPNLVRCLHAYLFADRHAYGDESDLGRSGVSTATTNAFSDRRLIADSLAPEIDRGASRSGPFMMLAYFGAEGPADVAGDPAAGGPALRGRSMPCATSASCCCQPCSHFQPAVMALTAAAVMKATIWFWSRWAPGTAWAISPANHPAAIAKTGVRIATNLPISDASLGVDDEATEESPEGGGFVMSLLNEGGVLLRLVQITYFVCFRSSDRHCCRNAWRWPGYWSISPGSAR